MRLHEAFNMSTHGADKWEPYFEIYERHLSHFRGTNFTLVEVGVQQGGSLEMWSNYFGPQSRIIGIDVDPKCAELKYSQTNIEVVIGNQTDPLFWKSFLSDKNVDVLIDDGGHEMFQQIATFENVFPHLSIGGIYICEDCHTSYMSSYSGGLYQPHTFIEYAKSYIDVLNMNWRETSTDILEQKIAISNFGISGMSFYDSVVVFEKYGKRNMQRVSPK